MTDRKKDPTMTSEATAKPSDGVQPAPPVEQADDSAVGREYRDNPDKPNETTVAQIEVLPEDQ